jgi:YbgC/YbaW family acyl-CoA thioester hydrolase
VGEVFRTEVFVRWADCDPAGIAYYPRFFEWLDSASHRLAFEMGVGRDDMLAPDKLGFPLVRANLEFASPARLYDDVEVRTTVRQLGRSSFTLHHEVWRAGQDAPLLLAHGAETRVRTGRAPDGRLRPQALTPAMRAVLERYLDEPAAVAQERPPDTEVRRAEN